MTIIYINPLGNWSTYPDQFKIQTAQEVLTANLSDKNYISQIAHATAMQVFHDLPEWLFAPTFFENKDLTSNNGGAI